MTDPGNAVDELERRVGSSPNVGPVDWESLWSDMAERCRHSFPADFKALIERFLPGRFGMVEMFHPLYGSGTLADRVKQYENNISSLHEVLNEKIDEVCPEFPHTFGVGPGQLCIWGAVQADTYLCWQIAGAEPDDWRVVACDSSLDDDWSTYDGSVVQLLLELANDGAPLATLEYTRGVVPFTYIAYSHTA